ncbi:hypothetical protein [Nocardioides nanhaiensis]|uniref:Uncharacterized protein n=1 Tax=Nocardioides nanhaiensis TaxID=1476871 RepID=A0ABP8WQ68_9ACTN
MDEEGWTKDQPSPGWRGFIVDVAVLLTCVVGALSLAWLVFALTFPSA